MQNPRRKTQAIPPGSAIALDWGNSNGIGEAVVFGGNQALILSPSPLTPGAHVKVSQPGEAGSRKYAVSWCGESDDLGRFKLALRAVAE